MRMGRQCANGFVNEISLFSPFGGSRMMIPGDGKYFFSVQANGLWTMTV
jgi:hypothetical protein